MDRLKIPVVMLSLIGFALVGLSIKSSLAQNATATSESITPATAIPQQAGKTRIGIGEVKVLAGLEQQLSTANQLPLIRRAAESVEAQLMNSLQSTRKFEIVARGDLEDLLREQRLKSGLIIDAADPKAATPGKIKGIEYLVLTTIDDFVDTDQSNFSQEMGIAVSKRTMRMSAVIRIYNTTTGILFESMAVPVQLEAIGTARAAIGDQNKNPKAVDDSAYVELISQLAGRISQKIVDAIYPAKVIALTGDFVTINRSAGTGVNPNELWEVFSSGKELKDPDTGEILGREEMKVGEIVITEVLPKFSKARMIGDNRGIAVGDVVRQKMQVASQPIPIKADNPK